MTSNVPAWSVSWPHDLARYNNHTRSELSARGAKRDVENTPKYTCLNCILAPRYRPLGIALSCGLLPGDDDDNDDDDDDDRIDVSHTGKDRHNIQLTPPESPYGASED